MYACICCPLILLLLLHVVITVAAAVAAAVVVVAAAAAAGSCHGKRTMPIVDELADSDTIRLFCRMNVWLHACICICVYVCASFLYACRYSRVYAFICCSLMIYSCVLLLLSGYY